MIFLIIYVSRVKREFVSGTPKRTKQTQRRNSTMYKNRAKANKYLSNVCSIRHNRGTRMGVLEIAERRIYDTALGGGSVIDSGVLCCCVTSVI